MDGVVERIAHSLERCRTTHVQLLHVGRQRCRLQGGVEHITSPAGPLSNRVAKGVDGVDVVAAPANQDVGARATGEPVVAIAPRQGVVAPAAVEYVIARTTIDGTTGHTHQGQGVVAPTQVHDLNVAHAQCVPGVTEGQGVLASTQVDTHADLSGGQGDRLIGCAACQTRAPRARLPIVVKLTRRNTVTTAIIGPILLKIVRLPADDKAAINQRGH